MRRIVALQLVFEHNIELVRHLSLRGHLGCHTGKAMFNVLRMAGEIVVMWLKRLILRVLVVGGRLLIIVLIWRILLVCIWLLLCMVRRNCRFILRRSMRWR